MSKTMVVNFNIGILGHVDSGKTTLVKKLSSIASTASFDKSKQSQERGITLDLGFSALTVDFPDHLRSATNQSNNIDKLQFTFVDCPGHSSLIRTIIGGIQIIDLMILVIDVQKGFQTQTAECLVIAELTKKNLIVVVNKIDTIEEAVREKTLNKFKEKIIKTLNTTTIYDENIPIYFVSALKNINIDGLVDGLKHYAHLPERNIIDPLLFYVDHCFSIKGQGTILTGTILQGSVCINDLIEIVSLNKEQKKVKSIQMFRKPVTMAKCGDRIGLCIPQLGSNLLERGIICKPGYIRELFAVIINVNLIKYYKFSIKSKSKLHFSIGHETVMGKLTIFNSESNEKFDISHEYEYVENISHEQNLNKKQNYYALVEFEKPIYCELNASLIASKLDCTNPNSCRIALWGNIQWTTSSKSYADCLHLFQIFKRKSKEGTIQRIVNENEVIVQNLFKKENRNLYIGKKVFIQPTLEEGIIDSTFGQTSKIKIRFPKELSSNTMEFAKNKANDVKVIIKYKKFIFNKNKSLVQ